MGTSDWSTKRLKIITNTSASCSMQILRTRLVTTPGPVAFQWIHYLEGWCESATVTVGSGSDVPECRSGWHHSTDHFKMSIEYIELVGEGWVVSRDTAQLHFVSLLLGITNIVFTSIGLVDNNWNKNRKCWKYSATTDTIFFIITNFFPPHQM